MLVLAVPVIGFSGLFSMLLGYTLPDSRWVGWISPLLGTVMYVWGGRPFLTGAVDEVRRRQPGMMLLIGLAITVAFLASWGASLGVLDQELDFWWELALLIVIMLLGHWIEMRSLAQTTSALDSLAALLPDQAERVVGDETEQVAPTDLRLGDLVVVRPGGRVPADGRIRAGSASMDESMITGESKPVRRDEGDTVVAGTVATDSGVRIEITAVGDDTALAGIQRLVTEAQNSSSRAQRIADRAAALLFWFALIAGIITAIVWTVLGLPDQAVDPHDHRAGHRLPARPRPGHSAGRGHRHRTRRPRRGAGQGPSGAGIDAHRQHRAVRQDRHPDQGPAHRHRHPGCRRPPRRRSARPRCQRGARLRTPAGPSHRCRRTSNAAFSCTGASDFTSSPAVGVTATVNGQQVQVGGPNLLQQHGAAELDVADRWRADGAIILHVLADGRVIGALKLADEIRTESRDAVDALHARNIQVVMITGDAEAVAASVAAELGIDRYFAGVRPEDKADKVKQLQAEGRRVAMVGDGVNDAPALAQADVGIAIGAGTDVAIASAGVILASDDPRSVLSVIALSQASYRKMKQNLWWAAGYNLISVPLAAGVLAPIGFVMPMSLGAILMSVSTIVVALNAQLLRRLDLRPETIVPNSDVSPRTQRDTATATAGHH